MNKVESSADPSSDGIGWEPDLSSNGLHDGHAGQVNVVVFCVTAVVPERDQLIAVGKYRRSATGKYQPREFVAHGPWEGEVAPERAAAASFILPAICGASIKRGRLISLHALVEYRGPVFGCEFKLQEHTQQKRKGLIYRAIRRSTSGACTASTKNVACVRSASSRAHRSASSWCLSGHMPSRYICHLRAHRALHSSGSTSTTVRIMSPRSSAPQPPSPRRATQGAPVSPQRAR